MIQKNKKNQSSLLCPFITLIPSRKSIIFKGTDRISEPHYHCIRGYQCCFVLVPARGRYHLVWGKRGDWHLCFSIQTPHSSAISRARAIKYRQENQEAVGGFFSQIGELYVVHHLWGRLPPTPMAPVVPSLQSLCIYNEATLVPFGEFVF